MSEPTPAGADPKFSGRDILVIEDEEMIASVIEEMLRDLGCRQVWIAGSAKEAQALLAQHRPHAAILDVNLGGDSGFHLAQTPGGYEYSFRSSPPATAGIACPSNGPRGR